MTTMFITCQACARHNWTSTSLPAAASAYKLNYNAKQPRPEGGSQSHKSVAYFEAAPRKPPKSAGTATIKDYTKQRH